MAKPFQYRLRTLLLSVVPIAVVALAIGYLFRRPVAPVSVTGTVRVDGVNTEWVRVVFIPDSPSGKIGEGITRTLGEFELQTWIDDDTSYSGVLPGSYAVLVEEVSASVKPQYAIPRKYQDAATSGLNATVTPDGPNNFNFNLTRLPRN